MTGTGLRCYEGPVWGGAAPTPPKTRFPRRTLGNEKSAGIPTCGFISFHNLSRPDEDAAIHSECQSHTSSQPPRRRRDRVESEKPHTLAPGPPGQCYPRETLLTPSGVNVIATFGHFAARSPGSRITAERMPAA